LKGETFMYTALFIVSVIMFGYLMYVLVKPEKF
jgi:K+-transporting ATPase, F subunit